MRCETSFFSLTLYKKQLTRYWPMWAVWLAVWTLAIPVTMWNSGVNASYAERLKDAQAIEAFLPAMAVCVAVAAPVVAVAVFFYLFRSSAANFIGALPLRREGVFATAFAAGYTILVAPLILTALLTFLVEWALGAVAVAELLKWLGGCMLLSFFWFCFATLCCVISGNMVASVCFYAIFNGVVAGMTLLIQTLLEAFLYGFDQFGQRVWNGVMWLTPIYKNSLSDFMLSRETPVITRFEMLWVYAAVGFLMLLAAVWLHHIRKAERAGDLIAFAPIRWVFRISVTMCGGLSFGMLLLAIIFARWFSINGLGIRLAGCCAVAAMVSWFVAEMLLQKSFKVFKDHWKGAVVAAVCFIVAICAIDMDWIGFSSRVPQSGQIHAARAGFSGSAASHIAEYGLTYDEETVKELVALHQYIVDHREELDRGNQYLRLEVEYDLGLTSMRRQYGLNFSTAGEIQGLIQKAQQAGTPNFELYAATPNDATVEWSNGGRELTDEETAALWAAVREDVEAGRYRAGDPTENIYINFSWHWEKNGRWEWSRFYPTSATTSVNAVLKEKNILRGQHGTGDTEVVTPKLAG